MIRGLISIPTTFQLNAGHPALDLVNTLDWRFSDREPQELLSTYEDLLAFTEQSKLLTAAQVKQLRPEAASDSAKQALADCTEFREALAEIFYMHLYGRHSTTEAREIVERFLTSARLQQKLSWKHSPHLEWELPASEIAPEWPLWALGLSASELMISGAVDHVQACQNADCRWLFLDTSKNHTRRWCDMKVCGNRMKARRFKSRRNA